MLDTYEIVKSSSLLTFSAQQKILGTLEYSQYSRNFTALKKIPSTHEILNTAKNLSTSEILRVVEC
jgi:ABC-type phosphate/phosphonate transport system ATPase subunit